METGTREERTPAARRNRQRGEVRFAEDMTLSTRRPADVWVPERGGGRGEAWDFAVTSGMQKDWIRKGPREAGNIFEFYEARKKEFDNTDDRCRQEQIMFIPLICEAHGGGWSPWLRKKPEEVSRAQWTDGTDGGATNSLRMAQRISVSLQGENARAVLRRLAVPEAPELRQFWEDYERDDPMEECSGDLEAGVAPMQ